ncbi:MAG: 3-oxoacyl-[acyl-carrier-protein] synthase [Nitrospirae bacterium]|nr:3-oxoacyl-[acyl-carrier-protein] synthase [Nitrospirota bacterium]
MLCYDRFKMNRVVVTGMGAVSPVGNSLYASWSMIKAGQSGIMPITQFEVTDIPWKVAGSLKDFNAGKYLSPKEILRLDPFVHYAVAAAIMAAEDAGLIGAQLLYSAGVIIGSSRGGIQTMEKALKKKMLISRYSASIIRICLSHALDDNKHGIVIRCSETRG